MALLPAGRTLSASIRHDGDELAFVLNGGTAWPSAQRFAAACPSLGVVRWHPHGGGVRVIVDRRARAEAAPTASFQQVNPAVAGRLRRDVVARALSYQPASAVDAYAGSGDTAAALHDAGVRVTAIELDAEAAAFAARRLSEPSVAVAARVEDAIGIALPADVVIMNPPRSGVASQVTDVLRASSTPPLGLLYVSCNPATLARDLGRLPNYRVASLRAYDMFPQTAHVETLCELTPALP
jgi:23S rRNA (uracil1939-C5)-methyltransferase